jgi:hypothetical protein
MGPCLIIAPCFGRSTDVCGSRPMFVKSIEQKGVDVADETIFQEAGITVTKAMLTTPTKGISIANTAGVSKWVKVPSKKTPIILIVVGVLTLFIVVGLIPLIIGIVMLVKNKSSYVVLLDTSSGKSEAFESKDEAFVDRIVVAVHKAIAARG